MSLKLAPATGLSAPYEEVVVKVMVILFVASDVEGILSVLTTPDSPKPLKI
jgi:hypothetical protein